jgi:hypothetical protein
LHRRSSSKVELAYAPRAHWVRRRKAARVATVISFIALIVVVALWVPRGLRGIRLVYLESQCASYRPHDLMICSVETDKTPNRTDPPQCWSKLYAMISEGGFQSDGTAFLHERFTPSGASRLIAIDTVARQAYGENEISFHCRALSRPQGFALPQELSCTNWSRVISGFNSVKVFGGKTDAANPSHFTIEAEVDGAAKTVDGWITDRDDNVTLEARDASATPPLRPSWASPH